MEMSAPLINAIVINALLNSNSRIKQMPPQIIHICAFYNNRLAAPDIALKCIEARTVRWPGVWKFYGSLMYIIALSEWRQRMIHIMLGSTQLAEKITTSRIYIKKMIMWHCSLYNLIASDVWRYNNPAYKLMTNKLQLVLIKVLIRSIFEHWSFTR